MTRGRTAAALKVRVKRGKGRSLSSQALARAPAQRPLCRAGQARGLPLARRLQVDRDRRQVSFPQARRARRRSRRGARRLEPGRRRSVSRATDGKGARGRHRYPRHGRRCPGVDFAEARFPRSRGARAASSAMLGGPADVVLSDMAANATGHRPTDHLKIMALVEAAARVRRRSAGARRRVPRQGAARRHRARRCSPASSAISSRKAREAGREPRRFSGALSARDRISRRNAAGGLALHPHALRHQTVDAFSAASISPTRQSMAMLASA